MTEEQAALLQAEQEMLAWLRRNPHPPIDATDTEAIRFYGGPRAALSLWRTCKAVAAIRLTWTGKASAENEVNAKPSEAGSRTISTFEHKEMK